MAPGDNWIDPNANMNTSTGVVQANGTNTQQLSTMLNAHAILQFLVRALPYLVFEKFGQAYVLPEHSTKNAKFRRYEALDASPKVLVEGVTPAATPITTTDLTAVLEQYGDRVILTDVLLDTDDSRVLQNVAEVVGEQAAEMIERMRIGVLIAGTNVEYATTATTGIGRSSVNLPISLGFQRRITRRLKAAKARQINSIIRSTPSFNTENVAPSFVAVCHCDIESDIRDMNHFIDVKDYGTVPAWENEIGSVEGVRYIYTTLMEPWPSAGGAAGSTLVSTGGTYADVYPVLYIAKNSYGLVPFKGVSAVTPFILNPTPSDSDPLGQRGHVAWKSMQTCIILNQSWLIRGEVACTKS